MNRRFALILGVLVPLGAAPADPKPAGPKVTADSVVRDMFPFLPGGADCTLLALRAEVDDRPLYVESALVSIRLPGENRWLLAHAYRHPKLGAEASRRWHLSQVFDAPGHVGQRGYDRRPTEAEVNAFIRDTWWKFGADEGFRLTYGEVFAGAWEGALGYRPKHAFPKPKD